MEEGREREDINYRDRLYYHLADESDRLTEDAGNAKNNALAKWSLLFWHKVSSIIEKRQQSGGRYDIQKFKDLEARCLEEYRFSNQRTLVQLREKLHDRDSRFVASIDSSDRIFRELGCCTEDRIRERDKFRDSLVLGFRIDKRRLVESELHKEHEVFSVLDSLRYEDFCIGGRSCDTHCFT